MEVSGQLHAPAALPPEKEPLVQLHHSSIQNNYSKQNYFLTSTTGNFALGAEEMNT
jgi:hypothetical protein